MPLSIAKGELIAFFENLSRLSANKKEKQPKKYRKAEIFISIRKSLNQSKTAIFYKSKAVFYLKISK